MSPKLPKPTMAASKSASSSTGVAPSQSLNSGLAAGRDARWTK